MRTCSLDLRERIVCSWQERESKTILAKGFILTIMLLAVPIIYLHAQGHQLQPIYSDLAVRHVTWTSDSASVVFVPDVGTTAVYMSDPDWHQYNLSTKNMTISKTWPIQPRLTQQES